MMHDQKEPVALPGPLVMLLAAGAGMAVASLYYAQPMLGLLAGIFDASPGRIGLVPTLTQLGYAGGILLLAPLGDRYDRRNVILGKLVLLAIALLLCAAAPSLGFLLAASLAIGLAASVAQDFVPAAATLAPAAQRGRTVGMVVTGLLLGILLSRVVSGVVAEHFGWRTMFVAAALAVAVVGLAAWRGLPRFAPTTALPYGALLASLAHLWRQHGALRRAALSQGLMSISFSAFWSTLALMLHGAPFHLGSSAAGAFGLAGAVGALLAPLAGRLADRRGPEFVIRTGAGLMVASFLAMAAGTGQLWLVALGAALFDLGFQGALVAHQTTIFGIDPAARSRLNAVLFTVMFTGMATGALLGSLALAHAGWMGVCLLAATTAAAGLALRFVRQG
jgi:predicted MFS family arabinose efflux permease